MGPVQSLFALLSTSGASALLRKPHFKYLWEHSKDKQGCQVLKLSEAPLQRSVWAGASPPHEIVLLNFSCDALPPHPFFLPSTAWPLSRLSKSLYYCSHSETGNAVCCRCRQVIRGLPAFEDCRPTVGFRAGSFPEQIKQTKQILWKSDAAGPSTRSRFAL